MGARTKGFNDIKSFGAAVVCTVQDGTSWKGAGDTEFCARGSRCSRTMQKENVFYFAPCEREDETYLFVPLLLVTVLEMILGMLIF